MLAPFKGDNNSRTVFQLGLTKGEVWFSTLSAIATPPGSSASPLRFAVAKEPEGGRGGTTALVHSSDSACKKFFFAYSQSRFFQNNFPPILLKIKNKQREIILKKIGVREKKFFAAPPFGTSAPSPLRLPRVSDGEAEGGGEGKLCPSFFATKTIAGYR